MLSDSNLFDYVNVMSTTLDATSKRMEVIANNIANVDTPDYKRKDVRFETELKNAFIKADGDSVDARVKEVNKSSVSYETYTDYSELSYRSDGNNVDIDTENAIAAEVQIKYEGLMELVNKNFSQMQSVMK